MLRLFVRTGCPYCAAVLKKLNEDNISFEEVNISEEANQNELLEKGGKQQVPFLIDDSKEGEDGGPVMMYESADIVAYLDEHYSAASE